jgi:hypothetical protein
MLTAPIAHLICEVFIKLRAVGLTGGNSFVFPITQSEIGDATGLSTVHVNRSIMQLRADNMIILDKGRCTIPSFALLKQAALFDPAYLHLNDQKLAAQCRRDRVASDFKMMRSSRPGHPIAAAPPAV